MVSKFQPFDIKKYCRVFFLFVGADGKKFSTYYERVQIMPDAMITREALMNAEDMKKRFCLKELMGIFIARTPAQVKEVENQL